MSGKCSKSAWVIIKKLATAPYWGSSATIVALLYCYAIAVRSYVAEFRGGGGVNFEYFGHVVKSDLNHDDAYMWRSDNCTKSKYHAGTNLIV